MGVTPSHGVCSTSALVAAERVCGGCGGGRRRCEGGPWIRSFAGRSPRDEGQEWSRRNRGRLRSKRTTGTRGRFGPNGGTHGLSTQGSRVGRGRVAGGGGARHAALADGLA